MTLQLLHPSHPIAEVPSGRMTREWYDLFKSLLTSSSGLTGFFNARDFGATGNGSSDDTLACQACIDAAAAVGGIAFFPQGRYRTTAPLTATHCVTILGTGYQSTRGNNYFPFYLGYAPPPTDILGTVFLPGAHDCFSFVTSDAVICEKFQISFNLTSYVPGRGHTGIKVQCDGQTANTNTLIRDVMVTNCDIGFDLNTCMEYLVDHCITHFTWNASFVQRMDIQLPVIGAWGRDLDHTMNISDSEIRSCQFWSGAALNHIWIMSGNCPRIIANKIAQGAAGTSNGILIQATLERPDDEDPDALVEGQQVEPGVIVGNSIEGQTHGISMATDKGSSLASQFTISGNQIWTGSTAILIQPSPTNHQWAQAFTIGDNSLFINGGVGVPIIQLSGCASFNIDGNTFGCTTAGGTSLVLGTNCSNIRLANSVLHNGVIHAALTTPAVPASAVTATNTNPVTVEVQVNGGTGVTDISVNGATAATTTNRSVTLNPGDTIAVTYAAAPTWTWRAINP